MKWKQKRVLAFLFSILIVGLISCKKEIPTEIKSDNTSQHPSLILTKQGVKDIKANLGTIPIFDKSVYS